MEGWMDGGIKEWNEEIQEWMDGWMNEWMDDFQQ